MAISLNAASAASRIRRSTDATGAPIRVNLIGGFSLELARQPVRLAHGAERLVAYLAIEGRPAPRSHVAGTLWPDVSEARAMGSLRSSLWRLRHIRRRVVDATGPHLELSRDVEVDVRALSRVAHGLIDRADDLDLGELDRLATVDELLPDWSDDWVIIERERLRQLRLHALEHLCHELTAAGRFGRAIELGLAAVAAEPLRESAHRELIKAHLAEGNRIEAIRQYSRYERLIRDELDLGPSLEMTELLADGVAAGR